MPVRFLEIGTFGDPKANIRFATGMVGLLSASRVFLEDIDLPVFSLNVTGELRIMADEISEKRCLGVVSDFGCAEVIGGRLGSHRSTGRSAQHSGHYSARRGAELV